MVGDEDAVTSFRAGCPQVGKTGHRDSSSLFSNARLCLSSDWSFGSPEPFYTAEFPDCPRMTMTPNDKVARAFAMQCISRAYRKTANDDYI